MPGNKRSYDFTVEAEEDLSGIWLHTAETWGAKQADKYLSQLEDCCASLSERTVKSWRDIHPDLKSCRCQKHVLFFLQKGKKRPVVIAVLHVSMDSLVRLQHRL